MATEIILPLWTQVASGIAIALLAVLTAAIAFKGKKKKGEDS